MEPESIYQGDFVVVNEKLIVKNHDIVVALLIDGTLLVKHFCKKRKHLVFYPFNVKIPTIVSSRIFDDAIVKGKVVGIVCNHKNKH